MDYGSELVRAVTEMGQVWWDGSLMRTKLITVLSLVTLRFRFHVDFSGVKVNDMIRSGAAEILQGEGVLLDLDGRGDS